MTRCGLLALAVLLLVAACGGEGGAGEGGGAGAGSAVDVVLTDFVVAPASPSLEPGAHVLRVVNEGETVHALAASGPGVEARTADLAPGESEELAVDLSAGELVLWCPVGSHRDLGMEATVAVGGAEPSDGTTGEGEEDGYRY